AQIDAEKADLSVHAGAVPPGDARPALGPAARHLGAGLLDLDLAAAAARAEGEVHGQPPFAHLHAEHRPTVQDDVAAAVPLAAERTAQAHVNWPLDALRQVGPGGEEARGLDVVEREVEPAAVDVLQVDAHGPAGDAVADAAGQVEQAQLVPGEARVALERAGQFRLAPAQPVDGVAPAAYEGAVRPFMPVRHVQVDDALERAQHGLHAERLPQPPQLGPLHGQAPGAGGVGLRGRQEDLFRPPFAGGGRPRRPRRGRRQLAVEATTAAQRFPFQAVLDLALADLDGAVQAFGRQALHAELGGAHVQPARE